MPVSITYRSVKGSNLTAAEVDGNFQSISDAIDDLEENPPDAISIAEISVTGGRMTITLTDASTFGPFDLPTAVFNWRGEWAAGNTYSALDFFTIEEDGLYLVLDDYTAPTEFDPDEENTDGPVLKKVFGVPANKKMDMYSHPGDWELLPFEMGGYIRSTSDAPATITVLADATDGNIEIGDVCTIRQAGAGPLQIVGDAGVTLNIPVGQTNVFRGFGASVTIIKVGDDEYDLSGDLALEIEETETA